MEGSMVRGTRTVSDEVSKGSEAGDAEKPNNTAIDCRHRSTGPGYSKGRNFRIARMSATISSAEPSNIASPFSAVAGRGSPTPP